MLVTLEGISIEVKPLQPEKADSPMLVTLEGISMEVKPLHPVNAEFPILVTLFGMISFVISAFSSLNKWWA